MAAIAASDNASTLPPCCYVGHCPTCENVDVEAATLVEGEVVPFAIRAIVVANTEGSAPQISTGDNQSVGFVDADGCPSLDLEQLEEGHGGMISFVSTRALAAGEVVTLIWDQQNRGGELSFGLASSHQLSEDLNVPSAAESVVSLNVYDEHLNLFVPDIMAEEGHTYEFEQTHLGQKHDATKVARPKTRISIKLEESDGGASQGASSVLVPFVQFGNLDADKPWLEWCPDGAGLKTDEDGHLYPILHLCCTKNEAPPTVTNFVIVGAKELQT